MKRIAVVMGAAAIAVAALFPMRSASQAPAQDSLDSARVRLAPVTVTATRQSTSIFAAPLAVTVVRRAQLENKRGYSLDDAVAAVPGVLAQSRYGASDVRITIRGFGARGAGDRSNAGTSRGIRVLIDGIPETEPDGRTSFDMVDLAAASRVEIVRSNASALWGNAGGGVVAISTAPDFDRPFASAQQMLGSYGFLRTVIQGGIMLGPASLAVTFTNTGQEGYRAHSDSRRALVNASITSSLARTTDLGLFITAANDLFHIPGPLTRTEAESNPRAANATYAARDERRHNRLGRIGVTLRHSSDSASNISAMAFVSPKVLQRSERGTFRDFNRHHLGGNAVYRRNYALGSLPASTSIGGDHAYQSGSIRFYSLTDAGTRGIELRDSKAEAASNTGVFVQQELRFGQHFGLDIGARYDRIRYDYRSFIDARLNDARNFERVSPKIGLNLRLDATHSIYANIGGGVEAPAGNETDPVSTFGQDTITAINPLLEPIRSTSYEVGTRRLRPIAGTPFNFAYDAALYHIGVRNEIVPYRGGRFYLTAGKVYRQGAELSASLLGAHDLELGSSITVSRNRYVAYVVDSVHYGRPGRSADYAGNDVAGIPGIFYSVSAGRSVHDGFPLRFEITMRGVGDYFTDDANVVKVPAYNTFAVTLSSGAGLVVGSFKARAFVAVENVTNRRYIGSAFVNPDVVNGVPVAFEPGAARHVVASISIGPRSR